MVVELRIKDRKKDQFADVPKRYLSLCLDFNRYFFSLSLPKFSIYFEPFKLSLFYKEKALIFGRERNKEATNQI